MRFRSRHSRRFASLVLLVAVLCGLSGCFLFSKKKSTRAGQGLIVQSPPPRLDPNEDPTKLDLSFKTTRPSHCELAFYGQNGEPTKDKAVIVPCPNGAGGTMDHTAVLPTGKSDQLFFVQITAWEPASTKDKGERVIIRQQPALQAGSGARGRTQDGKASELLVARFNIPLHTAEIHRHVLPAPIATDGVTSQLKRTAGCQAGVPKAPAAAFRSPAPAVGIAAVASRDFASGTFAPHPNHPNVLQASFPALSEAMEKWTLYYDASGVDGRASTNAIGRLLNVEMESSGIDFFEAGQLAEAADAFKIDAQKPLRFAWTTNRLGTGQLPYLSIQIGRPDNPKAVYCVFDATKNRGEIDAKLLQGLEPGKHVVLVELSTNQYVSSSGWIFTFYDWRSGRIER